MPEVRESKKKIGILTRDVFHKANQELGLLVAFASENFAMRYGNGEFNKAVRYGLGMTVAHVRWDKSNPLQPLSDLMQSDKLRYMTCSQAQALFYNHHVRYNKNIRLLNESLEFSKPFCEKQFQELSTRMSNWLELHQKLVHGITELGRDIELPTIASMLEANPQPLLPPPVETFSLPNQQATDAPPLPPQDTE